MITHRRTSPSPVHEQRQHPTLLRALVQASALISDCAVPGILPLFYSHCCIIPSSFYVHAIGAVVGSERPVTGVSMGSRNSRRPSNRNERGIVCQVSTQLSA